MNVAVLAEPKSWYLADLVRAAGADYRVTPVSYRQLWAAVEPGAEQRAEVVGSGAVRLVDCDAVLLRSLPAGTLEQVIFRLDVLGRAEAAGCLVMNPPRAVEAAVDKYLATARLAAAGLPVPRTWVCESPGDALAGFESLGGDVVVKPLFGSEGRGLMRLTDRVLAERAFAALAQIGAIYYLQEFVPHEGHDLRALVIGDELLAMRRSNPHDWRTNVRLGATAESLELPAELQALARKAAAAVGAPLAGVDLLPGRDGLVRVIEVNAVPGWKALAAAHQTDVARRVLDFLSARRRGRV